MLVSQDGDGALTSERFVMFKVLNRERCCVCED